MLIYERSRENRQASAQRPKCENTDLNISNTLKRKAPAILPEVSEMQMVRHYTNLSRRNLNGLLVSLVTISP